MDGPGRGFPCLCVEVGFFCVAAPCDSVEGAALALDANEKSLRREVAWRLSSKPLSDCFPFFQPFLRFAAPPSMPVLL